MSRDELPTTLRAVVALLAPTLGQEKSEEVVSEAARALGIADDTLDPDRVRALLGALGRTPGLVGVAARFARTRYERRASEPPAQPAEATDPVPASTRDPSSARPAGSPKTISRRRVVMLLAPTLGEEKADEVVVAALRRRGLPENALSRQDALVLLDELAALPGVIGVTARFVKARVILFFSE
jgi:hypothetical protein